VFVLLLSLLVPALLGNGVGRGVRRWWGKRISGAWFPVGVLLLASLAALVGGGGGLPVGFYDLSQLLLLFAVGFLQALHAASLWQPTRTWWLGAGGSVAGLILLEAGARLLPPPPLFLEPVGELRFLSQEMGPAPAEELAYPALYPRQMKGRLAQAKSGVPLVLHVGDSMVQGTTLGLTHTFVAELDRLDTGRSHVNAGVDGTGPDHYFLLIQNWIKQVQVDTVVLHLFPANDLMELDQGQRSCRGESLLTYGEGGVQVRCPEPDARVPFWLAPAFAQAPYGLRLLGHHSAAARQLQEALLRMQKAMVSPSGSLASEHLGLVLQALGNSLSERGIHLVVTVLPFRGQLEAPDAQPESVRTDWTETLATSRKLGLRTLDLESHFQSLVDDRGAEEFFLNEIPGDIHWSKAGHAEAARWLLPKI
jgi:hypothetical protein